MELSPLWLKQEPCQTCFFYEIWDFPTFGGRIIGNKSEAAKMELLVLEEESQMLRQELEQA